MQGFSELEDEGDSVYRTHKNGVSFLARLQSRRRQSLATVVDRASSEQVGFKLEIKLGRLVGYKLQNFDGLGNNLRSCVVVSFRFLGQPGCG